MICPICGNTDWIKEHHHHKACSADCREEYARRVNKARYNSLSPEKRREIYLKKKDYDLAWKKLHPKPPTQRYCKECNIEVGKGKSYCDTCMKERVRSYNSKYQQIKRAKNE
ncbi:MAG: hypothetical protein WC479_08220 [Candidatus Izemoplasmatales bacterium]